MLITIVGKRGRGKTTLVKELISESDADRVLILDFLGEYSDINDPRVQISRGYLYPFLKEAWETCQDFNKTLIVLDEIDCYSKYDEYISYVYKYGRHGAIEIIAVSRTFMNLPVISRRLTDVYYLFQITEWIDLKHLERHTGKDFVLKVQNLDFYEYKKVVL